MNKQFKDSINQSYEEAIKAMEEGQSIKVIRLSLLECAARLEAVAKIEFVERTKLNALGYKLLGVAQKLGSGAMDVGKAYEFLTGLKLEVKKPRTESPKIDIDDELAELAKLDFNKNTSDADASVGEDTTDDEQSFSAEESVDAEETEQESSQEQAEDTTFGFSKVKPNKSSNELRATTLAEYVGQEKIKPLLKEAIAAAKKRGEPLEHVLMFGSAGLGKTTLAKIIANEMGGECTVMNGATIKDVNDFIDVIKNVKRGDVVFIDEIHRMSPSAAEAIYKAMEDFELQYIQKTRGGDAKNVDIQLPPFTLIGATTHSGLLSKPMRDRFSIKFKLEPYTTGELTILATNSMKKLGFEFGDGAAEEIASRSRGVPRVCNTFVKRIRDKAQLLNVQVISKELAENYFKSVGIDDNGLDESDYEYLSTLYFKFDGGPVGMDTLCAALGEGRNIVEEQIEPYLIYLGYINVSSNGRELTKSGKEYVKERSDEGGGDRALNLMPNETFNSQSCIDSYNAAKDETTDLPQDGDEEVEAENGDENQTGNQDENQDE